VKHKFADLTDPQQLLGEDLFCSVEQATPHSSRSSQAKYDGFIQNIYDYY